MPERHGAGPLVAADRFFSTAGRVGVIRFVAAGGVIVSVFCMIAWGLGTLDAATFPLLGAIGGAAIAKLFAEAGRRCHDVNGSAAIGALVLVGSFVALFSVLSLLSAVAATVVGGVAALGFAATFLRPGHAVANRYGEPPSGMLRAGRPRGARTAGRSLMWAAVAILGCATVGLAIQTITDQIRADRERRHMARTRQVTKIDQGRRSGMISQAQAEPVAANPDRPGPRPA